MSGAQPTHASRRILRPAQPVFIFATLIVGFAINLLPIALVPGMPDWCALTLCFWCVHQPQRVGMAVAFALGLASDIAHGGVLGQHALAYVLLAFAATGLSRRILWFPHAQQALHVLPMLFATQLTMFLVGVASGRELPALWWFLSSLTGAAIWSPVTYLLLTPQFRPEKKDVHRPI